ncbi:Ig-like domain-containing protein [Levilactobacillus wangkuiensis]|uniref:Ig-like domain-containing protein n=1 Tax=Levilactobacillus wangkuiensis TaxID=2799566 RepID=UPI001940DD0F|nr:Ig-like domain-containing protein [Levilactobacillus wangkuiensis]
MKLKKILLQLGLLLLAAVGLGMQVDIAHAQPGTDLKGPDAAKAGAFSQDPNFIDGDSKELGSSYPTLDTVTADGVDGGRITKNTKNIYVAFSGSATISKTWAGAQYVKFYADVLTYNDNKMVSLQSSPKLWTLSSGNKTATPPSGYITIPVNLKNLGSDPKLPIYIGFSYQATRYSGDQIWYNSYKDLTLTGSNSAISAMANVTINDGNDVPIANREITGTAEPNTTVTLTGVDGNHSAVVNSDGTYTISLGTDMLNVGTITVTESNDFGDTKSATANVVDSVPLTITPATSNLTVSPDDWDANIKGKSSSDIATWLAKQSNLVVTKQNSSTALTASGDGLAFDTASDLSTLAGGDTQAVQINASDTAGDKSTDPATINVTRGLGNMQFTTISQLVFGNGVNLAVPSTQTLYAPGKYNVDVSDSRATGSPWYLTAQASTLTDAAGHTFSGHVVYADGKGTVTSLDAGNAVQVASGNRSTSTDDLASDWNQKGGSYTGSSVPAGVYLQANPNVYAGGSDNEYSGSMTWTLSDAPKGN